MMTAEQKGPGRKSRKRDPNGGWNVPYLEHACVHAPQAARAYSWSIYSMVPVLGLLLGPLAILLGWLALRRGRSIPEFRGRALCVAAMIIGALVTLTQWSGLWLMFRGLRGS